MLELSQYEKDTRCMVEKLEGRLDTHLRDVWEKLNDIDQRLMNRLPVWATVMISVLTAMLGVFGGMSFVR